MPTIAKLLAEALQRLAVDPTEIAEAKRRRGLIEDALRREFPECRIYFNGSLAHGDANDPLADFDMGVVVPDAEGHYGPGKRSADEIKSRVRQAVQDALGNEFQKLRVVVEGRKRSVLVRFSDPVTPRASDFTGDIICGIDHPERGLWIPRFDSWDRSHPEEHTRLVRSAIDQTGVVYAHCMRLLKHWNGHHGEAFCSWHMKALALKAIVEPAPLIEALEAFFAHAGEAVRSGPTPDPAGVGPSISPKTSVADAVSRLATALSHVQAAMKAEATGRPLRAQSELAAVFPGIVDVPPASALADEERNYEISRLVAGSATGVGAGMDVALPGNRGWGDS